MLRELSPLFPADNIFVSTDISLPYRTRDSLDTLASTHFSSITTFALGKGFQVQS